jgi:hypothetical protein
MIYLIYLIVTMTIINHHRNHINQKNHLFDCDDFIDVADFFHKQNILTIKMTFESESLNLTNY